MGKKSKKLPNPRKLGAATSPGRSRILPIRIAESDRAILARAAALRGASESEYVRLIVLARAKEELGMS